MANLFGSSYESVGESTADLLLKTRGKVKIQYGSKFIDLVKDGKINCDLKVIFKEDKVGVKDGIYITPDNVFLKAGDSVITLVGSNGTTYVSFLDKQVTTSDNKHTALQNIGFLHKTISEITEESLQNGIIYIEDEQKLYTVLDGVLSEYTVEFPNPFTKQFVIAKQTDEQGALVIKGNGDSNSLRFDNVEMYAGNDGFYVDAQDNIHIVYEDSEKIIINRNSTIFYQDVLSNKFQSINFTPDTGFSLFINTDGQSTLVVDNLVVRRATQDFTPVVFPSYWYKHNNVIQKAKAKVVNGVTKYYLTFYFPNAYRLGDTLGVFVNTKGQYMYSQEFITFKLVGLSQLPLGTVSEVDESGIEGVHFQYQIEIEEISKIENIESLVNQTCFLINSQTEYVTSNTDKGFDLSRRNSINTRIGKIEELELFDSKNNPIEGYGLYSEKAAFKSAQYTSEYDLPMNDDSSKFASTEWVNKLLPIGSIIMFGGQNIPEGWHICDGTNGTVDLIDKFIKGGRYTGLEGGETEIQLTKDNMPEHTHQVISGTVTTSEAGGHTHTYTKPISGSCENAHDETKITSTTTADTSYAGQHTHTIDISSAQLTTEGLGKPLKWEPKYYTLIFIQRIY